jgi:hypothetical protein
MPALSRRPAGLLGGLADLFTWFVRARDWYFALPRLQFEAMTLGLAVLFGLLFMPALIYVAVVGLLFMPALIYVAGMIALKSYANGGVFSLYYDWFAGLFGAHSSFWIVVIGPFAFVCLFRFCRWALRKL